MDNLNDDLDLHLGNGIYLMSDLHTVTNFIFVVNFLNTLYILIYADDMFYNRF